MGVPLVITGIVAAFVAIQQFLTTPLVRRFFDHITADVITFTDVDDQIWNALKVIFGLESVSDATDSLGFTLAQIQAQYDRQALTGKNIPVDEKTKADVAAFARLYQLSEESRAARPPADNA